MEGWFNKHITSEHRRIFIWWFKTLAIGTLAPFLLPSIIVMGLWGSGFLSAENISSFFNSLGGFTPAEWGEAHILWTIYYCTVFLYVILARYVIRAPVHTFAVLVSTVMICLVCGSFIGYQRSTPSVSPTLEELLAVKKLSTRALLSLNEGFLVAGKAQIKKVASNKYTISFAEGFTK